MLNLANLPNLADVKAQVDRIDANVAEILGRVKIIEGAVFRLIAELQGRE